MLKTSSPSASIFTDLEDKRFLDNFRFPLSYRYLMANYGYGLYMDLFILYPPEPGFPDSIHGRGARVKGFIDDAIREETLEYHPAGNADIAKTLYPFGASENGDYLAWQLDKAQFAKSEEWPVWIVGPRMEGLTYGGRNILEFFSDAATDRVKEVMGPGYTPLPLSFKGNENAELLDDSR